MDIKFRITKYLAVSALAMLLLGACSKNNIYINYPDEENNGGSSGSGNDDNNGNPAKENALITFSASVEGRNITRAMSPMPYHAIPPARRLLSPTDYPNLYPTE